MRTPRIGDTVCRHSDGRIGTAEMWKQGKIIIRWRDDLSITEENPDGLSVRSWRKIKEAQR